jgi:hypothetical protein
MGRLKAMFMKRNPFSLYKKQPNYQKGIFMEHSNNLQIYVHGCKGETKKKVSIPADITGAVFLRDILKIEALEFLIFLEDVEEPLHLEGGLESQGVRHNGHIHIHKCKKIKVQVIYNGESKHRSFSPSTRIFRVLKWSLEEFHIVGNDQTNMVLKETLEGAELDGDIHLGSLVPHRTCSIVLYLVPKVVING